MVGMTFISYVLYAFFLSEKIFLGMCHRRRMQGILTFQTLDGRFLS